MSLTWSWGRAGTSSDDWSWVHGDAECAGRHQGGAGQGADQHQVGGDGQGDRGDGAEAQNAEQTVRTFVKRAKNVRSAKRDCRRQLSISNWTQSIQNSGEGVISEMGESGVNLGANRLASEDGRQRPARCDKMKVSGSV